MSVKKARKKRRSLVRLLASCVPSFFWDYIFPVPPRMCISSSLIQRISSLKQNNFPSDDSNTSFCSFRQNFHNQNQQLILNSTLKRVEDVKDNKFKALQEELDEIKKMVAKLMEQQSEQCSCCAAFNSPSEQLQKSSVSPLYPLLPPSLPPPLPDSSLMPVNLQFIIKKKKNVLPQNSFPKGKELLRELKKVQLRKVEKSPNSHLLKKTVKVVSDPRDILTDMLRKRFINFQSSPLDSSLESGSLDENSFKSGTINSCNIQESNEITVS